MKAGKTLHNLKKKKKRSDTITWAKTTATWKKMQIFIFEITLSQCIFDIALQGSKMIFRQKEKTLV